MISDSTAASTANETIDGEDSESDVFANLDKYDSCSILAVIVVIGLFGDVFCLRYLTRKRLREKSYAVYFITLAITDIVTLLCTGLPVILEWFFHQSWRLDKTVEICITFHCILEVSENLSSMLMLAIATDRFIAVVHPLRRKVMCTSRRALWTSVVLTVVSVLLAIPDIVLLSLGLQSLDCRVTHESTLDFIEKNRFLIFSLILPVIITLFLNFKVLRTIHKAKKARANYLDASGSSLAMSKRQLRITLALVTVTIVSALLLLPVVVLEIWEFFLLNSLQDNQARKDVLANAVCTSRLIEVINLSINFFALTCVISEGCRGCFVVCSCESDRCCNIMRTSRQNSISTQLSVISMHELTVQR
ncbi:12-(S)-hydroxy-5,8,10,14-eicosatetraenoic acid receptor-like [Liolophura sinensis]|uniref:12-(S)-hydroxy-5,8,10,14-eicosatetraenoic acid receptor-like n=1 Tax=Liolophura sinensis TaxID=3198878 RepID=UPI0031594CB6